MKTMVLATATLLVALTTPHAEFKNNPPPVIDDYTPLECVPVRSTEHGFDRDPVYKTEIDLRLENGGATTSISVKHTTMSGSDYDRSNQYHDANIWQTPNRNEWFWKGYRGRLTMVGEVLRSVKYEWWYIEKLFAGNGRLDFVIEERCHIVPSGGVDERESNNEPTTPPSMRDAPRWLRR